MKKTAPVVRKIVVLVCICYPMTTFLHVLLLYLGVKMNRACLIP